MLLQANTPPHHAKSFSMHAPPRTANPSPSRRIILNQNLISNKRQSLTKNYKPPPSPMIDHLNILTNRKWEFSVASKSPFTRRRLFSSMLATPNRSPERHTSTALSSFTKAQNQSNRESLTRLEKA